MGRIASRKGERLTIEALAGLDRDTLGKEWERIHRVPVLKGIKRGFLERAIAYRLQVEADGGLPAASRKLLLRIGASDTARADVATLVGADMPVGTRLVRDWHGTTHHVEVVEGGFAWNCKVHSSLSAVAKAITGAHWSGRRFFGL